MQMTMRWFGPGYGLYDRALGIPYILGLWEAVEKNALRGT